MLKALLLAVPVALAEAATTGMVTNPRDLMLEAIDAQDGTASGMLTGELADAISQNLTGGAPLKIEVSTLKRYREPGCRRLNVRFTAEQTPPHAQHGRVVPPIDFGVDFCRNGRPPTARVESAS